MKKLSLLILALAFIGYTASAQSGYLKRASDSKTTDTLTNAATSNVQLAIAGYQGQIGIQTFHTKLTGTTAGTVFLYASNDGTTYNRIPSIKSDGTVGRDSLILANSAGIQSKFFVLGSPTLALPAYSYYQIRTVGSGTQTTKIQAFAIWRKE